MLWLFVLVGYELGLRPNSETLWLKWEDVDYQRWRLRVVSGRDGHRTKTGKSRSLPVSDRLLAALRDHAAKYRLNGSPWVFHHTAPDRHAEAGDLTDDDLSVLVEPPTPPSTRGVIDLKQRMAGG